MNYFSCSGFLHKLFIKCDLIFTKVPNEKNKNAISKLFKHKESLSFSQVFPKLGVGFQGSKMINRRKKDMKHTQEAFISDEFIEKDHKKVYIFNDHDIDTNVNNKSPFVCCCLKMITNTSARHIMVILSPLRR